MAYEWQNSGKVIIPDSSHFIRSTFFSILKFYDVIFDLIRPSWCLEKHSWQEFWFAMNYLSPIVTTSTFFSSHCLWIQRELAKLSSTSISGKALLGSKCNVTLHLTHYEIFSTLSPVKSYCIQNYAPDFLLLNKERLGT